jgi:phosphatidylinositol alpha-mannosyltransferase
MVPRQPTFVVVGRLEERKGASVVIDVVLAHNARIANEPWQLLVVGDGPLRHRLEDQVGGNDAVTFLGAISESEKRRVVRESSAVVCPATGGESFGLVLLEAMASEVPVVASDIDGYRQAAGGHATLFAPGDATSCEAAMERALATTNEQVRAAHQHASAWSMDTLVQRYESIYQEAQLVFASR